MTNKSYDVIIAGGGHNALTAAAYLGRAGKSVLVLERQDHLGGASVSAEAFPGIGARLSRYSYLVSLLPQQIIDDLGLRIRLAPRRFSSYTPLPSTDRGLLVDTFDPTRTRASFESLGASSDFTAWNDFYARTTRLAQRLWPTVTQPLLRAQAAKDLIGDPSLTRDFLEHPIGEVIERSIGNDLVRGVVLTDALISTFASAHDADLQQNKCFLYHVIGGGTGDWNVPVGGMGAVCGELLRAAEQSGMTALTDAEVVAIDDGRVTWRHDDSEYSATARHVLWAAAPGQLAKVMNEAPSAAEGAQVKVNVLLSRLPRLKDATLDPAAAFGGTFHINEGYAQLESAYQTAQLGHLPTPLPAEIYCHSLADPSILSAQPRESGAQTLTVFSLQTPDRLLSGGDDERDRLQRAVLDSLSSVLAEPIEDAVMRMPDGTLCIETKTTRDLQETLAMPGGNIFHGPLSWPYADDDAPLDTPAQRWGVETSYDTVLLAGAGSRRGGGVSGLGGYHAARAVLEISD